jgi:molybdate transport system substrate-binding protein
MTDVAINGLSSMATRGLLEQLAASFAAHSGRRVSIESVGGVAARKRVEAGEPVDLVVLASKAIDELAVAGHVDAASRVALARSGVAVAVKAGTPHPLLDDEAAVREAVLAAHSVGYSTGPSGVYLTQLFERWGIAERIAARCVQARPGVAVGTLIARGEVELGFQQMSELIGMAGIDVLGMLPASIQTLTVFTGTVAATARAPGLAREFLAYAVSPEANAVKARHGMEPVQ